MMTATHYLIFLGCLLACDIAALYSYFFYCEAKHFNRVYNTEAPVALRFAFPVQCVVFALSAAAFYMLSPDKTGLEAVRFGSFAAAAGIVTACGFIPTAKRSLAAVQWIVEAVVMSAVVFMLPDNPAFEYFDLPAPAARAAAGLIWFAVFKAFVLLGEHEAFIPVKAFGVGTASALVLFFAAPPLVALLRINVILGVLMFMVAPFCFLFGCVTPLQKVCRIFLCFVITASAFQIVLAGKPGIGILMVMYAAFEIVVCAYRLIKSLLSRKKIPLSFVSLLLDKGATENDAVSFLFRYDWLFVLLMLLDAYTDASLQVVVLGGLLYLKLYYNITCPKSARMSLRDLFKKAKSDARSGFAQTEQALRGIREKYAKDDKADE